MMKSRLVPCPNCEKPSLMLVPDLTKRPVLEGLEEDTSRCHYLVKTQMCNCQSISHVVIEESSDDLVQELEYTIAVNIIPSQPGLLGVDGKLY